MSDGFSFQTGVKRQLEITDYVVFSLLFIISAATGFYHAFKERHKTTEFEFHFAGRSLHPVPVSMSLAATYFSAVTILGIPAEVYTNNSMFLWSIVASLISTVFVAHVFAPFFHNLHVTSCYEYIEKRFCRPLRLIASCMFLAQYMLYLGIVVYLPCLTLQAVTGVSLWYTMVIVCIVCTLYTILGGMRSVVWVDTIQFLVIVIGLTVAFVGGANATGGIQNALRIANERGRIKFDEFSLDPRTRHSVWTLTVGYSINIIYVYGLTQLQIQRICTLSTQKKVKLAVWFSFPLYVVVLTLVCMTGLVMYAFYSDCHPVSYGLIDKNDQLMPLFVLDVMGTIPGMSGIFLACVFSGCLSTISSCLNTLSTVILEDFVKPFCCRKFAVRRGLEVSRLLVFIIGCVQFLLAAMVSEMGELILQLTNSLQGMMTGPLMGLFISGIFLPWTNSKGAMAGLLTSFIFMFWLVVGTLVENPSGTKPLPTNTSGCNWNVSAGFISTTTPSTNVDVITYLLINTTAETMPPEPAIHNFYKISYLWYGAYGMIINVFVTAIVSFATGFTKPSTIDSRLICPLFDRLCPCFPERIRETLRCGVRQNTKPPKTEYDTDVNIGVKDTDNSELNAQTINLVETSEKGAND